MKNKHLSLQDRKRIEQMLNEKKIFTEIAQELGKDKSTISREIRGHVEYFRVGGNGQNYNACKNRYGCQKFNICSTCNSPKKFKICRRCAMCNLHCPGFEKEVCPRHTKPPYVCNGCGKRSFCTLEKKLYMGDDAHEQYRTLLCESRKGVTYTEEEILRLDQLISPLIRQGQSPHHVFVALSPEQAIHRLRAISRIPYQSTRLCSPPSGYHSPARIAAMYAP